MFATPPGRLAVMYIGENRATRILGYVLTVNTDTGYVQVLDVDGRLTDLESLRENTPEEMDMVIQHV